MRKNRYILSFKIRNIKYYSHKDMIYHLHQYKYSIIIFISILFSCEYTDKNQNQKINQTSDDTSIITDNLEKSKTLFSEFLNERRDESLNEVSIYNLDIIYGFRNLKLETNLDSLKTEFNLSELKEYYYSQYSAKLDILHLKSNIDFGTVERTNLVEVTTTLFFWENLLSKIIINYDCSTMFGNRCIPPDWFHDLSKVFGKHQREEKSECEELPEEEFRKLKYGNDSQSKSIRQLRESVGLPEIGREINCNHIYIWEARKTRLIFENKYSQNNYSLIARNNKPNENYSTQKMSINISLLDKAKIIDTEVRMIENIIKNINKFQKIKSDSLEKDEELKKTELNF